MSAQDAVLQSTREFLVALGNEEYRRASRLIEDLSGVLRGRLLLKRFENAVATGAGVAALGEDLFLLGSDTKHFLPMFAQALADLKAVFPECAALIVVDVSQQATVPSCLKELAGIALVSVSRADCTDRTTVVHEMAHALLLTGHRVLDEGLAEFIACQSELGEKGAVGRDWNAVAVEPRQSTNYFRAVGPVPHRSNGKRIAEKRCMLRPH